MLSLEVKIMNGLWRTKNAVGKAIHDFFVDEEGDTNLISIVIVLVIVIAMAAIFRTNIGRIVKQMWLDISEDVSGALGGADVQIDGQDFQ